MTGRDLCEIRLLNLGAMEYEACLRLQREIHGQVVRGQAPPTLLLVEHPSHVFTLGKNADPENLLLSEEALERKGIRCFRVERGGDVTYHGPGQIILYAILRMSEEAGVLSLVHTLEEVMIILLRRLGLPGSRNRRNRGAWVGEQKVGFVGLGVRKGVSIHGMSLNVNPDLDFFADMNPCGMPDAKVSSISRLLRRPVTVREVQPLLLEVVHHVLGEGIYEGQPSTSKHASSLSATRP